MQHIDLQEICRLVKSNSDDHLKSPVTQQTKLDGSIVTNIDIKLQSAISTDLKKRWPDINFLGEEMSHVEQSTVIEQTDRPCWVLDPLDGTTNFVSGFPFYGISLALILEKRVEMGVIYDPVRDEMFASKRSQGVLLNGMPLKQLVAPNRLSDCVANIDYKRLTESLASRLVRNPPYRSQRNLGSCVLEWCWLAAGRFQIYAHGGEKLWDYAAGSLILQESGGIAKTFENQAVTSLTLSKKSVVAACTPKLFEKWSEWVFNQNNSFGSQNRYS